MMDGGREDIWTAPKELLTFLDAGSRKCTNTHTHIHNKMSLYMHAPPIVKWCSDSSFYYSYSLSNLT
jgi:hypothetical protein